LQNLKQAIELKFETLGQVIYRFPWMFIGVIILITLISISQLGNLSLDMSDEGFLHPDDEILSAYLDFREQFGRDDLIVLAIHSDKLFSRKFIKKLLSFHHAFENNLEHLDDVISMLNARNTYGVEDGIVVEDLLEKWPELDFEVLRKNVLSNPLYINRLISADGDFTTMLIRLESTNISADDNFMAGFSDEYAGLNGSSEQTESDSVYLTDFQKTEIVNKINSIAESFNSDDFRIFIGGSPVVTTTVKNSMRHDLKTFVKLVVFVIGGCLLIMFRRISGCVIPLLVVLVSLISTLAIMAECGVSIKLPTMILPSFILAVGVGDSVHLLALFFQQFDLNNDPQAAIVYALKHSGLAIMMTSLTTMGGLLSFSTAKIAPVSDLGLYSSLGVFLAFLFSVTLLPAILSIVPLKKKVLLNNKQSLSGVMEWLTKFSTGNSKRIIIISFLFLVIACIGINRLNFSHDIISWLPQDTPVCKATRIIDSKLKCSVTLELIIDTGKENGLYDRTTLLNLEKLQQELLSQQEFTFSVGKVILVTDVLKEINQALNENRKEFYKIPEQPKLIPQEFLLFENSGSDDLEDFIDSRFQLARVTVKVPWQDAMNYVPFIKEVESLSSDILGPGVTVKTTGIMVLFGRIIYASIYSAVTSYLIAFVVISIMMIILVGDLRLGFISMIPNLSPILLTIGFMGLAGIPMNMFTMLIGSIAIGIAVDDTIHFVYNFHRYYRISNDPVEAVRNTLNTTGVAMLTTTIVLSLGFFIFMFATMKSFFYFGLLTGIALIMALIADFFLAPALMILLYSSNADKGISGKYASAEK
jgi:uncharacterized protein